MNIEISLRLAKKVRPIPGLCYHNSRRIINQLPDFKESTYVEGFAQSLATPTAHGWVEKDGEIIDTTYAQQQITDVKYYPAIKVVGMEGIKKFIKEHGKRFKIEPFFAAFGPYGFSSPDWVRAYNEAYTDFYKEVGIKETFINSRGFVRPK